MTANDELRKWAHGPDEGDDWLEREDKPYRIYGLHEKLEEYEGRMEAMGIEVDA